MKTAVRSMLRSRNRTTEAVSAWATAGRRIAANASANSAVRITGRTLSPLGAPRAALVRQVALEGVVIAAGAGLLGILMAGLLVESATLVNTVVRMEGMDLEMDSRVLAVALAASNLTAVLVSLMPALQIWRVPAGAVLKDGGGAVRRRSAGQRALVAAQVGASLSILTQPYWGAGRSTTDCGKKCARSGRRARGSACLAG